MLCEHCGQREATGTIYAVGDNELGKLCAECWHACFAALEPELREAAARAGGTLPSSEELRAIMRRLHDVAEELGPDATPEGVARRSGDATA